MTCPRCGSGIEAGRRFCGDCGAPLSWRCTACGGENLPGKRFCGDCGAAQGSPLRGPEPAPDAGPERRQISVMFVDLVGSTALGTRLDPEDLREVIGAYRGAVTGLIARHAGFVAHYLGDGVLAFFGYPAAREDDAEQAVRAGLAISDAVARLATLAGPPGSLSARIGIATGLVVVGDLIGSGSSQERAVIGETPNLAARLQTLAEPGTVVISDQTRRLTGKLFEYRELAPTPLKGIPAPVTAWSVLGESVVESRFEALRNEGAPLIGRSEEFELLQRRWLRAREGEGCVVLLSGDAGIGKSRLVAELEQSLEGEPMVKLRLLCSPTHQDTALHPVARHLERAAGILRADPPEARLDKLAAVLPPGPSREADLTLLADVMAIPGVPEPASLHGLAPARRRDLTLGAILRSVEALAREAPVLAVLEDIHWADATTLELLDRVVEAAEQLPMLLLVTTRPEAQPAWAARPHVLAMLLGGLQRRQAATLVAGIAGERALPEEILDGILARADGVPLFLEELARTVLESGRLREEGDRLVPVAPLPADLLPSSL
jgi:class 3 adenylate cyclase